jgi:hypothetical protein
MARKKKEFSYSKDKSFYNNEKILMHNLDVNLIITRDNGNPYMYHGYVNGKKVYKGNNPLEYETKLIEKQSKG